MGILRPVYPVDSNRVLELQRGNPAYFSYTLPNGRQFPSGTLFGVIEFRNTYGQLIAQWDGNVSGGTVLFEADPPDDLPRGTSWQLYVDIGGTQQRLFAQGTVVRNEAPIPNAPQASSDFLALQFNYSFDSPGSLVDPAWQTKNGKPYIFDNSAANVANALGPANAANSKAAALYYSPVGADAVKVNYNVVRRGAGSLWVVLCSNSDMSSSMAIRHTAVYASGNYSHDQLQFAVGTGPIVYVNQADIADATTDVVQDFTVQYNPLSNTYAVYQGDSLQPVLTYIDDTNAVLHGEGQQYTGLAFTMTNKNGGLEVASWQASNTL